MDSRARARLCSAKFFREGAVKLFSFWRSLATFRVRIAFNLKSLTPDEEVNIDLLKGEQRDAAFKSVNPMMAIPALVVDDGPALIESLAIIEYLDEVHPNPPLLPRDPRGRARVRGLAQIVACDTHPLIVPRIRNYFERELKLDEPTRNKWIHHWIGEGLAALETNLARDPATGRHCHGDVPTIADICLVSQVVGAQFFEIDLAPYPTVKRIADAGLAIDAFARAHPLKQRGAPQGQAH
jgi:maleylacetoacetate isomerase/maleylpyruvate isomerase